MMRIDVSEKQRKTLAKARYEELKYGAPDKGCLEVLTTETFRCQTCTFYDLETRSCNHKELKGTEGLIQPFGCCIWWSNPPIVTWSP